MPAALLKSGHIDFCNYVAYTRHSFVLRLPVSLMVHRRLMLWLLLVVVGFSSTIGLPMHQALHAESDRIEQSASYTLENAHQELEDSDTCASCHAYAQLSLAFNPRRLHISSHETVAFAEAIPLRELFSSLWLAYSSGCGPPTAIA